MSDERKECISFHPKEALCPKVMTAKELFEGRHYVIPKYQRDYVWEEKNILPFVQAIAEGAEEYVFMGTMLFRKIGDDKFEVMDGRQRLTTMAALLRSCGETIEGRETLLDDSVNKMIGVFEKVKREVGVEGSESEFSKRLLNSVYFVVGTGWGGVNFGAFFFVAKTSDRLDIHQHEAGHGLQNLIFGVFMPFVVAIPSAVRCVLRDCTYTGKKVVAGVVTALVVAVSLTGTVLGFLYGLTALGVVGLLMALYAGIIALWAFRREIPQYAGGAYVDYDAIWFEGCATRWGQKFFKK